jgi:hypothetical protein
MHAEFPGFHVAGVGDGEDRAAVAFGTGIALKPAAIAKSRGEQVVAETLDVVGVHIEQRACCAWSIGPLARANMISAEPLWSIAQNGPCWSRMTLDGVKPSSA